MGAESIVNVGRYSFSYLWTLTLARCHTRSMAILSNFAEYRCLKLKQSSRYPVHDSL